VNQNGSPIPIGDPKKLNEIPYRNRAGFGPRPGFFLDNMPRTQVSKPTQRPGTGPGFPKISISHILLASPKDSINTFQ